MTAARVVRPSPRSEPERLDPRQPDPVERHWHRACRAVGVSISLQEGTRHTILAAAGGVLPERLLRALSRYRDGKSLGR